jgi:hypothetical protein
VWGLLCCPAGLLYGLLTTGQPDNVGMDILSVLAIVLLFCGSCVGGVGVLGLVVSLAVLARYPRPERHQPIAPVRFARLGVLPWAGALLFFAGGLAAQLAPAVLCSVHAGTAVDVSVHDVFMVGRHHLADGTYPSTDGDQAVVIQDASPPVGDTVRACVGWLGYHRAWTRFPWSGLWVLLAVGVPLLVVEAVLVWRVVRGGDHDPRTVRRRHWVV